MLSVDPRHLSPDLQPAVADAFGVANGFLGYRGLGGGQPAVFMAAGLYDRCGDKWREPVNLPDPFCFSISVGGEPLAGPERCGIEESQGYFAARCQKAGLSLRVVRLAPAFKPAVLLQRFELSAEREAEVKLCWECLLPPDGAHGPHIARLEKQLSLSGYQLRLFTNEGRELELVYSCDQPLKTEGEHLVASRRLKAGERWCFTVRAFVGCPAEKLDFQKLFARHTAEFAARFYRARVVVEGDPQLQEQLDYAAYHLLAAANPACRNSVPARGPFCQTYKGAIFWDTEMFVEPFFERFEPATARALIEYRLRSLPAALSKARKYGHEGAFFSWEAQEDGLEACEECNVTDPVTGQGIRTYFVDKQVHISADIAYSLLRYADRTGDASIWRAGGYELLRQVMRFYRSLSQLAADGLYHLNDVIGPDEYHERVDDDFYTNYLFRYVGERFLELSASSEAPALEAGELESYRQLVEKTYLPRPVAGVYEQFSGYFQLEDLRPAQLAARVFDREYWGQKASATQVIKQADVIALLGLFPERFSLDELRRNYEFYEPRTEHGSSLSASMYGRVAKIVGRGADAAQLLTKSASADFDPGRKLYAGGVYIGGNHIASYGGSLGLITTEPVALFGSLRRLQFCRLEKGRLVRVTCDAHGITEEEI